MIFSSVSIFYTSLILIQLFFQSEASDLTNNMAKVSKRSSFGKIYTNEKAEKAYRTGKANSVLHNDSDNMRVAFINYTDEPLVLCWVDDKGQLRHHYELKVCVSLVTSLGDDGLVLQKEGSHIETTRTGHSFLIGKSGSDGSKIGGIVGCYRPLLANVDKDSNGTCLHILSIHQARKFHCLHSKSRYKLSATVGLLDPTPVDTSNKKYQEIIIAGWVCKCEVGLFDQDLDPNSTLHKVKIQLEIDLKAAAEKLPPKACEFLQKTIPIYINKIQYYGPKCAPIRGRGMCFHPDSRWLIENGMSCEKCGAIELYEAGRYLDNNGLWHGKGGVMIHELAHAYHNKYCEDGYENKDIMECYNAAMEEKLYDNVKVHTDHEGGLDERKAYATTDCMEYFAELSVAFLGGTGEDKDVEYNKWYPFNRSDVRKHDPRAYRMLCKIWQVEDDEL
jgi:hypothetical protein